VTDALAVYELKLEGRKESRNNKKNTQSNIYLYHNSLSEKKRNDEENKISEEKNLKEIKKLGKEGDVNRSVSSQRKLKGK
jgi:hypothetical protein